MAGNTQAKYTLPSIGVWGGVNCGFTPEPHTRGGGGGVMKPPQTPTTAETVEHPSRSNPGWQPFGPSFGKKYCAFFPSKGGQMTIFLTHLNALIPKMPSVFFIYFWSPALFTNPTGSTIGGFSPQKANTYVHPEVQTIKTLLPPPPGGIRRLQPPTHQPHPTPCRSHADRIPP